MEYRWHLARWAERDKTLRCPHCGKKNCFKEYVDEEGRPADPQGHTVGRCDHASSCGYHVTPKEAGVSSQRPEGWQAPARKQRQRIEISAKLMGDSMRCYEKNIFVQWLYSLPLTQEQRDSIPHLLLNYCVGTSNDGGTIWWQVDEEGIVRTGKKMLYRPDGHRAKDEEGNSIGFNWIHAIMRRQGFFPEDDYELLQCLFGQHLLPTMNKDSVVHLVESEKTAFLMALLDPHSFTKNFWMACGGLYNLKESTMMPLKSHTVVIYPDTNGIELWQKQTKGMDNVRMSTGWMSSIRSDDPKGADIADVCIRDLFSTPEGKLQRLTERNEAIATLVNRFNLVPK